MKQTIRILDWFYAIRVCIKYKIIWNPFCKLSDGHYYWIGKTFFVEANPFYKYFLETFVHEVGHNVAKRNGYKQKVEHYLKSVPEDEQVRLGYHPYMILLEEEAFASRFSRKAIGSRCNSEYLLKCFYTYTACGYRADKCVDKVKLTDKVDKLTRRILG